MPKKRLALDWSIKGKREDFRPALTRYRRYLENLGYRGSTIGSYLDRLGRYLEFAQNERPSIECAREFRDHLIARNLSRSTVNNYCFAIKNYYEMLGEEVAFPILTRNDVIPYYLDQEDVLKIFAACVNLKHYAMLQTIFYGCLRASEVCQLDDADLDFKSNTIRIRNGKGGKDGMVIISEECATTLKHYLEARPPLEIDGLSPLFYTDFGRRWDRRDVYRMFMYYKKKAGVKKHGGVHVFGRHTAATIMVANGCDIRIVKELLRHKDIRTTLRYAHVSDKTKREMYERSLVLM